MIEPADVGQRALLIQLKSSVAEVFLVFLRLGLTSFGGPVAHLGYVREEFVVRRKWLEERAYADLLALCQFLPAPASSQVGMAIGLSRAGWITCLPCCLDRQTTTGSPAACHSGQPSSSRRALNPRARNRSTMSNESTQ